MKTAFVATAIVAVLCLTGCNSTRSISNSGYGQHYATAPGYSRHELNEYDVLGIDPEQPVTEADIQAALTSPEIRLTPGASILLVQSGALFPDAPLVDALSEHFRVVPFSGFRPEENQSRPGASVKRRNASVALDTTQNPARLTYTDERSQHQPVIEPEKSSMANTLRLAAARANCDFIVCCWGIIESASEPLPTKTVSWMPVVKWVTPDERQHSRIQLKLAVIDVASGAWTLNSPDTMEDKTWSTRPRREVADQKQVEQLKSEAYQHAARQLVSLSR